MDRLQATLKLAWRGFHENELTTRAAGLAFYTALSFGPMVMVALWLATLVGEPAQAAVIAAIHKLLGPGAAAALDQIVASAELQPQTGSIAAIVGMFTLVFAATSGLSEVQGALDRVWKVRPAADDTLLDWLRRRTVSLLLLVGLVVIGLVSTVASTVIGMTFARVRLVEVLDTSVSAALVSVVLAAIFRSVPDRPMGWRKVAGGAVFTAVLFTLGRRLLSLYFSVADVGGPWGAAGSLLVLLVWVYAASFILLVGAQLTYAWSQSARLRDGR